MFLQNIQNEGLLQEPFHFNNFQMKHPVFFLMLCVILTLTDAQFTFSNICLFCQEILLSFATTFAIFSPHSPRESKVTKSVEYKN